MDRYEDAKKRLAALHQPIPRPTKAAVAQNKAEIASRSESSTMQKMMGLVKKGPDVARAAQTGEPSLADPEVVSAKGIVDQEARRAVGLTDVGTGNKATVEVLNDKPGTDLPPASDTTVPPGTPFSKTASNPPTPSPTANDPNELKPNAPADPNELKPMDTGSDPSLPPPTQVNEIQQGQSSSTAATAKTDDSTPASDEDLSSSRKHKKKGLQKINPF
jgi:hypothetical protein